MKAKAYQRLILYNAVKTFLLFTLIVESLKSKTMLGGLKSSQFNISGRVLNSVKTTKKCMIELNPHSHLIKPKVECIYCIGIMKIYTSKTYSTKK